MDNEITAMSVLLGLPGFELLAVSEHDGELELAVETTAGEAFCEACGVRARLHDRRPTWVRDLPIGGRPVTLVWVKRVWRCAEMLCPRVTWTETVEAIGARMSLTERARAEACRRVGQDADSVAEVARAYGAGWATIMAAVTEHGQRLLAADDRMEPVRALGLDETAFLAATAQHPTLFVTGFVDVDRHRLLDVVEDRCGASVSGWLSRQDTGWRDGVQTVALDPHAGYRSGLLAGFADRADRGLAAPVYVVDHFHAIGLANAAIDDIRAAAAATRSTGSAGSCCAAPSASAPEPGTGCSPASTPATHTASSAPPGSPRKTSAASTPPPTRPRPSAD